MRRFEVVCGGALALLLLAGFNGAHGAEDSPTDGGSLAEKARDPTQPLTAFAVRYDFITDFHNLPGADQQQLVLQPIIPWKWGNQTHIARITLPYVTNAPDWGQLSEDAAAGLPPNYTPTADQEGFGDTALVDLIIQPTSWGRQGFGAGVVLPTASDPALGSEKWSVGPAYVTMTKLGDFQGGFLGQWLFSVAGDDDRDDVNSLTIQPFGGISLKENWSLNMSNMAFNYDLETSRWTSLPLGVRLEKLVKLGKLPTRLFVEYEYNFADSGVAPKNTIRLGFVPLL